jgi:hypothetical protein
MPTEAIVAMIAFTIISTGIILLKLKSGILVTTIQIVFLESFL